MLLATSAQMCPLEQNACTTMVMTSVRVSVRGPADEPIADARVRFATSGSVAEDCENIGQGEYACGQEVAGRLTITVQREGYSEVSREVTVEADACHVIGQDLEVVLQLAPFFGEARVYSSVLIEDDTLCEAAVAQGFNCARVAEFCPDGALTIMITDIVSSGTYARDAQGIAVDCSAACDIPADMRFAHDLETDVLTDDYLHENWIRVSMDAGFNSCR